MNQHLDDNVQLITNESLSHYWPAFENVAYALYDKNYVYLFNHPGMKKDPHQRYQTLKRDEQFNGCTLIIYRDYPTAIVDLELYDDDASVFSILVHELFHGFQHIKGDTRFADELLGITYPLIKDHVEYRRRERTYLYQAVLTRDNVKKRQFLADFIALREKRAALIADHLLYENLIETIEGPAWYVEVKSYVEKSSQVYDTVVKEYGQALLDPVESNVNIRRSCYSSGLYICLLLDEFVPDWKDGFWETDETVYELLKSLITEDAAVEEVEISAETERAVDYVVKQRRNAIEHFEKQLGFHLWIEGQLTATSFDPMNIILYENKLLHKNFIKVEINRQDYLIQQPVMAYYKDRLQNIMTLHLIVKKEPVWNSGSLAIDGVGVIRGKLTKKGKVFHLCVD